MTLIGWLIFTIICMAITIAFLTVALWLKSDSLKIATKIMNWDNERS